MRKSSSAPSLVSMDHASASVAPRLTHLSQTGAISPQIKYRCLLPARPQNLARSRSKSQLPVAAFADGDFGRLLHDDMQAAFRAIGEEVVLESSLHVPSVNAGQCFEQYGLPPSSMRLLLAPSLKDGGGGTLAGQLEEGGGLSPSSVRTLAACLASPFDEEDLNNAARQRATQQVVASAGNRNAVYSVGELLESVERYTARELWDTLERYGLWLRRMRRIRRQRLIKMFTQVLGGYTVLQALCQQAIPALATNAGAAALAQQAAAAAAAGVLDGARDQDGDRRLAELCNGAFVPTQGADAAEKLPCDL